MTVDLDALIAEARAWADSRAGWNQYQVTLGVRLADALESTLAELRQEWERADEASHAAGRHKSDAAYWENEYETAEDMKAELRAALSRAEETIARIDGEVKNFEQSDNDALCEIERHLTEYDKQKEADRG